MVNGSDVNDIVEVLPHQLLFCNLHYVYCHNPIACALKYWLGTHTLVVIDIQRVHPKGIESRGFIYVPIFPRLRASSMRLQSSLTNLYKCVMFGDVSINGSIMSKQNTFCTDLAGG